MFINITATKTSKKQKKGAVRTIVNEDALCFNKDGSITLMGIGHNYSVVISAKEAKTIADLVKTIDAAK